MQYAIKYLSQPKRAQALKANMTEPIEQSSTGYKRNGLKNMSPM